MERRWPGGVGACRFFFAGDLLGDDERLDEAGEAIERIGEVDKEVAGDEEADDVCNPAADVRLNSGDEINSAGVESVQPLFDRGEKLCDDGAELIGLLTSAIHPLAALRGDRDFLRGGATGVGPLIHQL